MCSLRKRCSLRRVVLVPFLLSASGVVSRGATWVLDPVMTSGTGCYSVGSVAGQTATNGTVGVTNGTGAWGTPTGVYLVESAGLAFPDNALMDGAGGSFSVLNASTSATDGRMLTRAISGLPTTGSFFLSALVQAGTGFKAALVDGHASGVGLTTLTSNGTISTPRPPDTGVFFVLQNSGGVRSIAIRVNGTSHVLLEDPVEGQAYFCVASIALDAVDGTQEILRATVNPMVPETYSLTVTNNLLATGSTYTRMSLAGTYRTANKKAYFDEFRVGGSWDDVAPLAEAGVYPVFDSVPTVTGAGNGALEFSAVLGAGTDGTSILAVFGTSQGDSTVESWGQAQLVTDDPTPNVPAVAALEGLATNTSYYVAALATNASYSVVRQGGTFLCGEVSVVAGDPAKEMGLAPGSFRVNRPAGATQTPLTVAYTVSGTAVRGQNFASTNLTGSVTLAIGQAQAVLAVTPLFDVSTSLDTTVTVTLADGPYWIGPSSEATILVENLNPPADKNVWIAPASGDASVAANWSQGRVPVATDDILLGIFSGANLTWDGGVNGLPDTVASWTQTRDYTGTAAIKTTYAAYSATFTNFTVTGNVVLEGGTLSPVSHATATAQRYRLCLAAGGSFTVGTNGAVSATGLGRYTDFLTWRSAAPHGGNSFTTTHGAFGSILKPTETAWGSCNGTGSSRVANGGGAIFLEVAGDFTNDGVVAANGGTNSEAAGAGGSIYVRANQILGTGSFAANGAKGTKSDGCYAAGAGGRIALVASHANQIPLAKLSAIGTREGWGLRTAAGTILLSSETGTTVHVKNYANTNNEITTPIPAADDPDDWGAMGAVGVQGSVCAHLILARDVRLASMELDATSDLDLSGRVLTVGSLTLNGAMTPPGTYGAADFAAGILDSSAGLSGQVVVVAQGTVLLVR